MCRATYDLGLHGGVAQVLGVWVGRDAGASGATDRAAVAVPSKRRKYVNALRVEREWPFPPEPQA